MSGPDYRGATSSNVGDEFHVLWTLRKALALLDPSSDLVGITVEGVLSTDAAEKPPGAWDGVDCATYFGTDVGDGVVRIEIEQLKYSVVHPESSWTIARLTSESDGKTNRSVIRRLAKAYKALREQRPDLADSGSISVRLVSNQPIHEDVLQAVEALRRADSTPLTEASVRLLTAIGLKGDAANAFLASLDFSSCGTHSRFSIEESIVQTIASLTGEQADPLTHSLMQEVERMMQPDGAGKLIGRERVLSWLRLASFEALFPCVSDFVRPGQIVSRGVTEQLALKLMEGRQQICLHGAAGTGKSTVLMDVARLLPTGSVFVGFDCFGGGRYLDSDALRHRPRDAFTHLSNELATQIGSSLILPGRQASDFDWPRLFSSRVRTASAILEGHSPQSLLVIAIDAADNAMFAADRQVPPERCFVSDFVRIGDIPGNVRFVVTCRTGRLADLKLPAQVDLIEVGPFEISETSRFVSSRQTGRRDEEWVCEFHKSTGGNPRVQRYSLDRAHDSSSDPLRVLQSGSVELATLFDDLLDFAGNKSGDRIGVLRICAAMSELPRPIPLVDLAGSTGLAEGYVRDVCLDLAPGIRIDGEYVTFSDEDFEEHLRAVAESDSVDLRACIADRLWVRRELDPYAARHVAGALVRSNRGPDVLTLAVEDIASLPIADPFLRRQILCDRLRAAMTFCRESGSTADAMFTLLVGAEAFKTGDALREIALEYPDLTAAYCDYPTVSEILGDSESEAKHGSLLCHLIVRDARRGDATVIRTRRRHLEAWLDKRRGVNFSHQWRMTDDDVAALIEAVLLTEGLEAATALLMRWSPKPFVARVCHRLVHNLIASGRPQRLVAALGNTGFRPPWDLLAIVPLALAGLDIASHEIAKRVSVLDRMLLVSSPLVELDEPPNSEAEYFYDLILSACEILTARGEAAGLVVRVLGRFAQLGSRRADHLRTSQVAFIDISLRALSLLAVLEDRTLELESYLVEPPAADNGSGIRSWTRTSQEADRLQQFLKPLITLYGGRARALARGPGNEELLHELQVALTSTSQGRYPFDSDPYGRPMRLLAARSVLIAAASLHVDVAELLTSTNGKLVWFAGDLSPAGISVYEQLALHPAVHGDIVGHASHRAEQIRDSHSRSSEKVQELLDFTRLLAIVSPKDAEALYRDAIDVAGGIDNDAIHELSQFEPMARRAVDEMSTTQRREVAQRVAVIASDLQARVYDVDRFPWDETGTALAILDPSIALAAVARWDDELTASRDDVLPGVLLATLERGTISPASVTALLPLVELVSPEFIHGLVSRIGCINVPEDRAALIEELSRAELLEQGGNRIATVAEVLALDVGTSAGNWRSDLQRVGEFCRSIASRNAVGAEASHGNALWLDELRTSLDRASSSGQRFTSADAIVEFVDNLTESDHDRLPYHDLAAILREMAGFVGVADRVDHLTALREVADHSNTGYHFAVAAAQQCVEWATGAAVKSWMQQNLLALVRDNIRRLAAYHYYGRSPLSPLLARSGLPDGDICSALLEGVERHSDSLDAATIRAVVGLASSYAAPADAAILLTRISERMIGKIQVDRRNVWSADDIPTDAGEALARFIRAFLGDVDARIRWRAAHVVRALARVGDGETIAKVIQLVDGRTESSYRKPDAPFHWLSAKHWLVVAMARLSDESPKFAEMAGRELLRVACDESLPHLLIVEQAKEAVEQLIQRGTLSVDAVEMLALSRAGLPASAVRVARRNTHRESTKQSTERRPLRFSFDAVDTLTYWYRPAVEFFTDVSMEEFEEAAETWIVDTWSVLDNPTKWKDEKRQNRFVGDHVSSLDHRHGTLPMVERFSTFLEWHAMWCAVGALLRSRSLATTVEPSFFSMQDWLRERALAVKGRWLSDLREPKPLEDQFYVAPEDVGEWLKADRPFDAIVATIRSSKQELLAIASDHRTRNQTFQEHVSIRSAFVSPDTAAALVRALATCRSPHDYCIPLSEHGEIREGEYRLEAWLASVGCSAGLDWFDPFRHGVGGIACVPSDSTVEVLRLCDVHIGAPTVWVTAAEREEVFKYQTWGDVSDSVPERFSYLDHGVRSDGWRLSIARDKLRTLLSRCGRDLIVEIDIRRADIGYEYTRAGRQSASDHRTATVIILRQDGSIEDERGRVGHWLSLDS